MDFPGFVIVHVSFEIYVAWFWGGDVEGGGIVDIFDVVRRGEERSAWTTALGIEQEILDGFLDPSREKVSLDRGDALGGLRGDDVDAEDAAVGFGALVCYLMGRG